MKFNISSNGSMKLREWMDRLQESNVVECKGDRKACVGVLLRAPDSVSLEDARISDLEMFFILRSKVEGDRFSGHVGLPGGGQEADETDEETVAREVFEEVGLILPHLDEALVSSGEASAFEYIGRVHDRCVDLGQKRVVVSALVYLQRRYANPQMPNLDPREIAACGWCGLGQLLKENNGELHKFTVNLKSTALSLIAKTLALSTICYTKVQLDIHPLYFIGDEGTCRCSVSGSDDSRELDVRRDFFLWGVTLSIVNDLFYSMTRARKRKIEVCDQVFGRYQVPVFYANNVHNILLHVLRYSYRQFFRKEIQYREFMQLYPRIVASGGLFTIAATIGFLQHRARL